MQSVQRLMTQFKPTHYGLQLDVSQGPREFSGSVEITGHKNEASTVVRLHAKDLIITHASINDVSVTFNLDTTADELLLTLPVNASKLLKIKLSFSGTITDAMHGLYPCYFEHNGVKKELLATQFESHHAREVFPCIDEPEAKATFDVTLKTHKNLTVLGNMPILEQREFNGSLITTFQQTPKMSSYLLAFVVGELHCKQAVTKNGTEVRVWATPAQPATSLDFALDTAVKTTEFFNEYFGIDYPLPKSDHVALPDFASGAMENWGLITYREVSLLVDPKTTAISIKEYVATVIAHELSHQWFGNLVTMRWWDELWLNESFASLMEYIAVDALYPEWNIWETLGPSEALPALRRDALAGVQPVKVAVHHPDEINTLFDGAIVYAKGARLLYMLYSLIGEHAFRKGLQQYFIKHKYSNTDGTDLWNAFSSVSDEAVADFMNKWLIQPGFPLVTVSQNQILLQLHQTRFTLQSGDMTTPSAQWPIPLAVSLPHESTLPRILQTHEAQYNLNSDEFIRINQGGVGHYSVRYTNKNHRDYLATMVQNGDIGVTERLLMLNDGAMQARAGIGNMSEVLQLLSSYAHETSEPVWDMISLIIADTRRLIEDEEPAERHLKKFVRNLIDSEYQRLGWDKTATESSSDTKLRATILGLGVYAEDVAIIDEAIMRYHAAKDIATLPSEIRGVILSAAVRHDDANIFDTLLAAYGTTISAELKQEIASSLTATKDAARIEQLLAMLTDQTKVRLQDTYVWFIWLIRNQYGRELAWEWMVSNWHWIETHFKNDKSYEDFPRYAASAFATDEWLHRYEEFFDPLSQVLALRRNISMGKADILSRAEWKKRDITSIATFLSKQSVPQKQ